MKFLKALFIFILVVIIIGGIGYIGMSMYYGPNALSWLFPSNTGQNNNMTGMGGMTNPNAQGNTNMPGMNMGGSSTTNPSTVNTANTPFNTISIQNRQKLMDIQNMVNQAIDLMTMDPYSRVTMPNSIGSGMQMPQTQNGNSTINIYPNGTNSMNITPPANTGTNTAPTTPATTTPGMSSMPSMPGMGTTGNMNTQPNMNYVYDQAKLEQLHRGIIKLAQGTMYLTQLNESLTLQAGTVEPNNYNYQIYTDRYNTIIKNKSKLNNAIAAINQATELVNVNPYGSASGYPYNAQYMDQMHRGIFALAQAMVLANDLNEDFTDQMVLTMSAAQYYYNYYSMAGMGNMNMNGTNMTGGWSSILSPSGLSFVFNIILVIMIVVLIISVFGAIGHILKGGNKSQRNTKTTDEANI